MTDPAATPTREDLVSKVLTGEAWDEFCDLLKAAGREILRPGIHGDPLDIAEGYRLLTRLLRGQLESGLEYGFPAYPHLVCTCHETIKIVAENPDNLYLGSAISGRYDYRVWGTRGEARWLSFNTFNAGGFGGGGRGTGTTLHEHQLDVAPDGTFEVILSRREHAGNWLPLEPDSTSLTIRQTFLHKGTDRPAELHIERLGDDGTPPPPLDPFHVYRSLIGAAHYVRAVTVIGAEWAERNAVAPNRFYDAQGDETRKFKDPQITWNMAYLELEPHQALVVRFMPPACDYWMIVNHNHWMETLDYRYFPVIHNSATATYGPDGSVTCVVSHTDPGVPNWISTAHHRRGVLGVRWVGRDVVNVVPETELTTIDDLPTVLGG